ncbi:uncharacterized protein LOC123389272 [Mustela putorius furo]|uniref:Uncharacterized protein LOC123389272 n=1 Tax=Mustela putorius furo TaxID=9669 RepID=A0A8U0RLI7_MUSPF|nr:uncharacterized protein LOC123389272 [Mustela putorius furo]
MLPLLFATSPLSSLLLITSVYDRHNGCRSCPGSGRVSQVQEAPTPAGPAGAWHRRDSGLRRRRSPSHAPLLPGWAESGLTESVRAAPRALSLRRPLLRCTRSRAPRAAREQSWSAPPRPDIPASGPTSWTRSTSRGFRQQQVAPDFPLSPLPWRTARPVAPGALWVTLTERDGGARGREELAHLRSLFAACHANRSGRLEREEFRALCAELRVRPADAEAVFQRLDADRDGAITFQEFARGFRGSCRGGRHRGWAPWEPASASAQVGPDPEDSQEDEGDRDAPARLGRTSRRDLERRPNSSPGSVEKVFCKTASRCGDGKQVSAKWEYLAALPLSLRVALHCHT